VSFLALALLAPLAHAAEHPLRVHGNGRFLVQANGQPFLYLGDTAWELFHRLTRAQADLYLENRAKKGFTVIQAVLLAELDGLHEPNALGDMRCWMTTPRGRTKNTSRTSTRSSPEPARWG